MSTDKLALARIALLGMVSWTAPAVAQFPEKFTNLQVLPKDTSRPQLESTMWGFVALNVRCNYRKPEQKKHIASLSKAQ
jgi:hypothetical protein